MGSSVCTPRPVAARGTRGGWPCHGYAANSAVIYIPGRTGRLPGSPGRLQGGFIGHAVYTARAELMGPCGAEKRRPHPHPPPLGAAGWVCPTLTPSPQVWVSPRVPTHPHAELSALCAVFLPSTGRHSTAVCPLPLTQGSPPKPTLPFANRGCPSTAFPDLSIFPSSPAPSPPVQPQHMAEAALMKINARRFAFSKQGPPDGF